MLSTMDKMTNHDNTKSNKEKPSINTSYNRQNGKTSVSSKLAIYMNSKEKNGISL